jgi:hypothetical protein
VHDEPGLNEKRMRLRYAGTCRVCGRALPVNTEAVYERANKTVRCIAHAQQQHESPVEMESVDPGTPGSSARREFERRRVAREERIRNKHPKLGGLIHALTDEPQSTTAWETGARGEERLGTGLNQLASEGVRVLHDRRLPKSRANIDHLAVTQTGVYVIDAKKYTGRPHLKVEGGLLRPRVERLLVGTRDCTKLVDGVIKQVEIVRGVVGEGMPVHGILCFVEADWPLLGGAFTTQGVEVLWPKRLYPQLKADGEIGSEKLSDLTRQLAAVLPPA